MNLSPAELYDQVLDRIEDSYVELTPALVALLDQVTVSLRDRYASIGVNLDDATERRAVILTLDGILIAVAHFEGQHFAHAHPQLYNLMSLRLRACVELERAARRSAQA